VRRLLLLVAAAALAAPSAAQLPSPEERAARAARTEADYRATLARLGLTALRPGADGRDRNAPNAANYDEAKVGAMPPLPPLLRTARGREVRTTRQWRARRAELARLLEREMYGRVPATAPKIVWTLKGEESRRKGSVGVLTRRYVGTAAGAPGLAIDLSVTFPPSSGGPVPLILDLGFPEGFRFPGFKPPPGPDWTERVIERGWAYAVLVPSTVQPDDGAGLIEGVIGAAARGRPRAPGDWGALRAWAWGASRALDLLAKDPRIDRRRVAVEGLSRYGKAALVAMAFDERFSLGFIGSSGAGGAKLLRRDYGERLENLASSGEYHWFAPAFLKYAAPPRTVADLPVDAHSLIALVAPRPLFIGAGNFAEDNWVDPRGSFEAARAASPVWRLHGVSGLVGDSYPAIDETRAGGRIAFRQQQGGHSNHLNWPAFLDFAARVWGLGPSGL
jgi:hypothetical protein